MRHTVATSRYLSRLVALFILMAPAWSESAEKRDPTPDLSELSKLFGIPAPPPDVLGPRECPMYRTEKPPVAHHSRNLVELVTIIGVQTSMYYLVAPTQEEDWGADINGDYLKRRLITLEDWRFDHNAFWYNAFSHPLIGSMHYRHARANNLAPLPSFATTLLGSATWELFSEIPERVSVNDMITETFAGVAVGEAFAQLGSFMDRGADTVSWRAVVALATPFRNFHNWLDGTEPAKDEFLDINGLPTDTPHRFDFRLGWSGARVLDGFGNQSWRHDLHLEMDLRLLSVPGAGATGTFRALPMDGNLTRIAATCTFGSKGLYSFDFIARAGLFGAYEQAFKDGDGGESNGLGILMAWGSSFEMAVHSAGSTLGNGMDLAGITGIFGPMLRLESGQGISHVVFLLEAYPDFAMVSSLALPKWLDANPGAVIQSIMDLEGYGYGMGYSAGGELRVALGPVETVLSARYGHWWGLEGIDWLEHEITKRVKPVDDRLVLQGRVHWATGLGAVVGAGVKWRVRSSALEDVLVHQRDLVFNVDLGLTF